MKFTVVGAGAWGTSFAVHLARLGHEVVLAPRRAEHAAQVAAERENADYLPGVALPEALRVEHGLRRALDDVDVAMIASPMQALGFTCARVREALGERAAGEGPWVISLAKGLEAGTHRRPSQVIATELERCRVGTLTGPTNALEVAKGLPAAMVLAAGANAAERAAAAAENGSEVQATRTAAFDVCAVQAALSGPTLRVYRSDDLAGVEYGACLKNIYAIAAGCCDGLRLGDNAKAALLTRALAEMVRVGVALGAQPETFYGLSGFGDLAATCHGGWSRNREFGQKLGEGATAGSLIAGRRTVVEGYRTAESFHGLCSERAIDAPILAEVYRICFEGRKPADALHALMVRELKRE